MKKDGYYFPHFSNARHDRKIKRVTKQLGVEGYGIYFMLLEVLREQSDYRYPISDIDLLADEFGTSEAKVMAIIKNYELFIVDELNMFFSENLIRNMQPYFAMKEQRSLAGKASAEKRKLLKENTTTVVQPFNDRSTTVQQSKVKESKVNEIKVESSSNNAPAQDFEKIGLEVRKSYQDLPEEFTSRYSENFYKSWLSINNYLDENCKFLRMWDNQLTVSEYKKIFDRAEKKEFSILQAKQALTELDASRHAKDKYNSVYHGFNTFIRTILRNV